MGTSIAALGAPIAHGDDAVGALAAALELTQVPPKLAAWVGTARIGVAAGRVYAGEYGAPHRSVYGVIGDAVNLAARLMERAGPGEVLVSGPLGGTALRRFVLQPLPPLCVKGKPMPVTVARLDGPRAEGGAHGDEPSDTLPLVGRVRELAAFDAAFASTLAGRGGTLVIEAEAGMGKSRLVAEAVRRAEGHGMRVLSGEAPAFGGVAPWTAWGGIAASLFGVPDDASPAERLAALTRTLDEHRPDLLPHLSLLGPVLDLQIPENEHSGAIPAPVRKQIVEGILVGALIGAAQQQPLLIVIEDAHWLDSLSADLLASVSLAAGDAPVCLVVAQRPPMPGDPALVPESAAATRIALGPFDRDETSHLITAQLEVLYGVSGAAPPALVDLLVERTQGNPFYIEELLRYLRDRDVDPFAPSALERLSLPDSLQRVVLERIDRLAETERVVLKVASVVGRRFTLLWLFGADPDLGDSLAIRQALDLLSKLDITPLHEVQPELVYLFKHLITREVAYASVTHTSRQWLHARFATFLEAQEGSAATPDVLAFHFGHGARPDKELHYRGLAAERAIQQGAYREAMEHAQRGLEIVESLPDGPQRAGAELGMRLLLGNVLLVVRGQGSPEAKGVYDRALELSRVLPRSPDMVRALFGLWTYYLFQGHMGPAVELAREILTLSEMIGAPEARMNGHFAVAASVFWTADLSESIRHAEAVSALYDPAEAAGYVARYAQNPRVTVTVNATWALCMMGRADTARRLSNETMALARGLNHEFVLAIALQIPTFVALLLGDVAGAMAEAHAWMPVAQRQGNPVYIALAAAVIGWARAASGDAGGLEQVRGVREGFLAQGVAVCEPLMVTLVADAALRCGRADEGLQILDAFAEAAADRQQRAWRPEHLRLRGELLRLKGASAPEAVTCFEAALAEAAAQEAHGLALRAAISLARVLFAEGRAEEAAATLSKARAAIDEGGDTIDVRAADALLASLARPDDKGTDS